MTGFLLLLCLCLAALPGLSAFGEQIAPSKAPSPSGLVVLLESDKTEYFLGENVMIRFTVRNDGKEPVATSWGGDYRGASRSQRFHVTATDESGARAADPDPDGVCFGGLSSNRFLKPGESYSTLLPLMRYCEIDRPGRYAILASHDLGWPKGDPNLPIGDLTLSFRMPTPEEAEKVVQAMEALPKQWTLGETFLDFRCFRYPVYLPILLKRAQAGSADALEGIGSMPFPEATAALIGLAEQPDAKGIPNLAAAKTLNSRLPDPEFAGPTSSWTSNARKRLAVLSWDPKLAGRVRDLGLRLLARPEEEAIGAGATMIRAVGTSGDAKAVYADLDRLLLAAAPRTRAEDNVLDFSRPVMELLRTASALAARGAAPGAEGGAGETLAYLQSFHGAKEERPPEWKAHAATWAASPSYPIRQAFLESLPAPLPDAFVPVVEKGFADPDLGVRRMACEAAGRSGRKEFAKGLVAMIPVNGQEWVLRSIVEAQRAVAAPGWQEAWIDTLSDGKFFPIALDALCTVFNDLPKSGSGRTDLTTEERNALRTEWQRFFAAHGEEIRAGKTFSLRSPDVKPELFGRARSWDMADGSSWPDLDRRLEPLVGAAPAH